MLTDKRIVITGVVGTGSIAYAVAERAQRAGAEVLLTCAPRDHDRTTHAAAALPRPAPVLDVDVTDPADLDRLAGHLRAGWGRVDGALHAIGSAPLDAPVGGPPTAPDDRAGAGAGGYAALARVVRELAPAAGAALVGLDVDPTARPVHDRTGVALESVTRSLARDLGPLRIRANLVAVRPPRTRAAADPDPTGSERAPLTPDRQDAGTVADLVCFLLSDHASAITGEVVLVDGGDPAVAGTGRDSPPVLDGAATSPDPRSTPALSRQRLLAAFATLSSHGIMALPAVGTDPDTTRHRLRDAIRDRFPAALGSYVFYLAREDDHFGPDGRLEEPVTLHVSGDNVTRAVHAALDHVGLRAGPGRQADTLLLGAGS